MSPFGRRSVAFLLSAGLATFAAGLVIAAFGGQLFGERSAGSDSWSRSLVGHRALYAFLEVSGVPVIRSRGAETLRRDLDRPLLVLEPYSEPPRWNVFVERSEPAVAGEEDEPDAERSALRKPSVAGLLAEAGTRRSVLLALPKWEVEESPSQRGWIQRQSTMEVERALRPLDELLTFVIGPEWELRGAAVRLLRGEAQGDCTTTWDGLERVSVDLGPEPQLLAPGEGLRPIIRCGDGLLVAAVDGSSGGVYGPAQRAIVVSDPDLFNNRGLARGDHGAIVERLVLDELGERAARGVFIDESLHGYQPERSLLARALSFPLVVVVLHVALAFGLLAWSLAPRFGRPQTPPPALPPGKELLLDNTAGLLVYAGDNAATLRRYLGVAMAQAARRFSLPEGTSEDDLLRRLQRLNRARGVSFDLDAVAAAARSEGLDRKTALRHARAVHGWLSTLLGEGERGES